MDAVTHANLKLDGLALELQTHHALLFVEMLEKLGTNLVILEILQTLMAVHLLVRALLLDGHVLEAALLQLVYAQLFVEMEF